MKKLVESIVRDLLPEDWWTDMSGDAQKQYLKDYPNSPKSIELSNPSGKKEKGENVIFEIITCEIEGTTAVVKLRDKYLGITFMDILSFIKIEGEWKIYNKLFNVECE